MKRTRLENSCCPIARSLDVIGDWWSLLIVRDALRGVRRFSEFQKNLGIAKNMLAGRLKMLVDEGILRLQPASDGSAWQGVCPDRQGPCPADGAGRPLPVGRRLSVRARRTGDPAH